MVAAVIGGIGRLLVAVGLLLLAFAGFQLWGTGVAEARAQEDLTAEFKTRLAATTDTPRSDDAIPVVADSGVVQLLAAIEHRGRPSADDPTMVGVAEQPATDPATSADQTPIPMSYDEGQALAVLEIPAIGVSKTIVEGTTRDALRSGPGHYATTPLPGRPGNAAVAGHRTTHGAPFFDIDLLQPGDEIQVETLEGRFTYVVEAQDDGAGGQIGHMIVDPEDVGVIADQGDDRITLTACHPKYSARQRIIVTATLVGSPEPDLAVAAAEPLDAGDHQPPVNQAPEAEPAADEGPSPDRVATTPVTAAPPPAAAEPWVPPATFDRNATADPVIESLGWQRAYAVPTAQWAAITALIAAAGWLAGRLWRRWPSYAMTVPPFGLALFYCFANLERFIPAV